MSSVLRNYRKIYTTPGADPSMPGRVYNLETNEYKVTYYQVVTGTSGTLTVPSGGTINSNEFGLSGNAILSKVDVNGKPTFESPTTSGGSQVTASLNVLTGAWVASGVYTSSSVALIYSIKIKGIDYHNLVYNNIIETVKVTADVSTINLQSVTDGGSVTTHVIETTGYVKTGGTSSQFLKADGSVDSNTYLTTQVNADWNAVSGAAQILNKPTIPTQVVPAGGTTGQILAKVDDTDYNLEWIENYANYTSVLKHTVKAGEAINKGQAVYVSSADGTNMIVSKASNTSEATSSKTMGLLAQTLATNGKGFVITEGLLDNVNTLGATAGDPVWLGTSGNLIFGLAGKPYAPAHLVFIGIVTRVSATVGEIFVKVQNGFELREIHDVDLISNLPNNNEILTFESSTSLWKPKTVVSALGFTPYNANNPSAYISGITSGMVTTALGFTPYNSTNPSGYITGITSGMVTTALGFTPYNATNPSGYITSSALTSYVPYTGATANVDLGTRTLTTPTINGVSGTIDINGITNIKGTTSTDSVTLSAEQLTTGTGTNWEGTDFTTGYTHTIGSTTPLVATLTPSANNYYQVVYTISGRTAGSVSINFGLYSISGLGNFTTTTSFRSLSTTTPAFTVTPTTDFDGTIVASVKFVSAPSSAISTYKTSTGVIKNEIRSNINANNTLIGVNAGKYITTGFGNTLIGNDAMPSLMTGTNNVAIGIGAGISNVSGIDNFFLGASSGYSNVSGQANIFIGAGSGYNSLANNNVGIGYQCLIKTTTGNQNDAIGREAGGENTTGSNNQFFGFRAGKFIANGSTSNTITNNSIFIGRDTKALADNQTNQIVIGYASTGLGSNTTVLGNASTVTTSVYGNLILGNAPASTSGAINSFSLTKSNNTGQTASTSISGWNYIGGTRQWATGAITSQSENVWGATTYSFVGASTITNAYGNVFNSPIAGTNATITNNYAAQFNGKVEANIGIETPTLAGLNTAGANLLIVSNNTATKGTITIGNNSAETVYLANQQFGFTNVVFYTASSATGFSISRVTASDTVPNFVINRSDGTTGIGGTVNTLSLITASTTKVKLFNSGNLTIQNGGTFTDNGYRLEVVGTSNFTDRVNIGNYATPSAQRMLTIGQDTAYISLGSLVGATSNGAMYINTATPSVSNYVFRSDGGTVFFNSPAASASIIFQNGGNIFLRAYGNQNTASVHSFNWTKPTYVSGTAGISISGWFYDGTTRNWLTGAITTQSENVWGATTYSFVGASTITNAYGNVFNAPVAGLNATITNNWAAQFNGNVVIGSTGQLIEIKQTANAPTLIQTGATSSNISVKSGTRSFSMINYAADANYFQTLGAKFYISTVDAQAIGFSTTNVERLTIGAGGGITVRDNNHFTFEVTNGTKFGTATTQKIAFWNATPIVQPANTVSLNAVLETTGLMATGSTVSIIDKPLVAGANTTPRTGTATDGVTSVLGNLKTWAANYHSGEVLYSEVSGEALNFGQLCYRNAAGKWQKATGSSSTIAAYNMLGICLQTVAGIDTAISILTRGYVESTYLSAGAVGNPLFMDATTAGSITNTAPSTAGNIVRVIGNVFWSSALQTNSKWIVYFNPDNTWIEL